MIIAYSYIRFSTPEQARGNSFERQTETSRQLAEKHGWRLDTNLRINDLGKSGFGKGQQRGLAGFLRAIEDGHVKAGSVLIVEQLDRLSRDQLSEALELFLGIIRRGIRIATLHPERIYDRKTSNDLNIMEPIMQFYLANQESEKKSFRALDNWNKARAKAEKHKTPMTTRRPAWIDLAEDGTFVLNKAKAEVIKRIFKETINGRGARVITNDLNRETITNIAYGTKRTARKCWNQGYVEAILTNPAVKGEHQPHKFVDGVRTPIGDPIQGYYPAAVSEETYYLARNSMAGRRKKPGRPAVRTINLFEGIIYDAKTKQSMRLANSSQIEKKKGCFRRLASYHNVGGSSWQYEPFERAFLQFINGLDGKALTAKPKANKYAVLEGRKKELQERIAEAEETILGSGNNSKTLMSLITKMEAQLDEIDAELATDELPIKIKATQDVIEVLEKTKEKDQRQIRTKLREQVQSLCKEVWILTETYGSKSPKLKVLTCQVHFNDDSYQVFVLIRRGNENFGLPLPTFAGRTPSHLDLREYDGKPYYSNDRADSVLTKAKQKRLRKEFERQLQSA